MTELNPSNMRNLTVINTFLSSEKLWVMAFWFWEFLLHFTEAFDLFEPLIVIVKLIGQKKVMY